MHCDQRASKKKLAHAGAGTQNARISQQIA
jgi:hypothetical protein